MAYKASRSSRIGQGIIIGAILAIGVAGIWMLLRPRKVASHTWVRQGQGASIGNVGTAIEASIEKRYHNTETRDIEWSSDGLPVRITIHRDYAVS